MHKTAPRAFARLLLAATAPLVLLTACADEFGVSPMPDGYKYSQQYAVPGTPAAVHEYPGEFKQAVPAPQPQPVMDMTMAPPPAAVTPAAAAPMAVIHAEAAPKPWQDAADDLLGRTEKNFGRLKEPVSVRAASPDKAGEASFEQALVHALNGHHYRMEADPLKAPYSFDYSIGAPESSGRSAVSLMTDSAGSLVVHKESGLYTLDGAMPATGAMPPLTDNEPAAAQPVTHDAAAAMAMPADRSEETHHDKTMAAPAPVAASTASAAPPPPPMAATPPLYDKVGPSDQPTYIYDAHQSGKNPDKTAYDQHGGAGKIVPADEGDDDDSAASGTNGGDVH